MPTHTTRTSANAWSPDVTGLAPQDSVPDALILGTSIVSGSVEGDEPAVRVQFVKDDTAGFVAEGVQIDEADPDLAEVIVRTGKVAQLIKLSREQWTQPNAQTLLADSVRRAVTTAANAAYINQAAPITPNDGPPAGLFNIPEITVLDGDLLDAPGLDRLIDMQSHIAEAGGNATHVLLNPTSWATLRKIKNSDGSVQSLLGAGTSDTVPSLLNIPVLVSNALPENSGLLLDRNAIASAVGQVYVSTSEHAYFDSDSVAVRCTWRFGANLVHPHRVVRFTVGASGSSSSSSSESSSSSS